MASLFALPLVAITGALAFTYPAIPADRTTPFAQRIAVKGQNSISVGWNTYQKISQPCVQYGTSSSSLTSQACSTDSYTYASSRMWSNAVTLPGLQSATTYYYKVVSGNSTVQSFLSPRAAGDDTPFNMDVVVDLGVYGPDGFTTTKRDQIPTIEPALEQSTIGSLARTYKDYELVIHPGDFAYADDWFLKPQNLLDGKDAYQAILETFYDNQLAPITQIKPYMASPGNHEAACEEINYTTGLCPQGQMNFTDYRNRFNQTFGTAFLSSSNNTNAKAAATMAKALANPPFWYSFEYGQAHVVMFNTETDFPKAPDGKDGSANLNAGPFGATGQQLAFLEADLSSVDRSVTPWLIVAGHRPWYSTGGSDNICAPCQAAFEPLFYKYGVDLALFGHVHNSQRFNPIYNGTVDPAGLNNPKAPMYVVAGGAGNIEGLSSTGANATGNVFAYDGDFSYGRVKVLDANNLGIEFYNSRNDTLLDSSVLYKAHGQQFVVQ